MRRKALASTTIGFVRDALALSFLLAIAACGDSSQPTSPAATRTGTDAPDALAGNLLFARANCSACHATSTAVVDRAGALPAPRLDEIGSRATLEWIEQYLLSAPHTGETGMRMPDLLHGESPEKRKRHARELASYLSTKRASEEAIPFTTTRPSQILAGETIWRTVGCVACHQLNPQEAWLATKWNASELARFLKDPSGIWHGGQMPRTPLTDEEAMSLAAWLLRSQGKSNDGSMLLTRAPGVSVEYFEGAFEGIGPDESLTPDRLDVLPSIGIPPFARADVWGVREHATVTIPTAGDWTFWIGSDDGSALFIDGELVAALPGTHGMDWKKGSRRLTAGPHEILATFFEGAGNATLEVHWAGPNQIRQEIPASAYTREAIELRAPPTPTPDAGNVEGGRALFATIGCVSCHGSLEREDPSESAPPAAPALGDLRPSKGCLAETPPAKCAAYGFDALQRNQLATFLDSAGTGATGARESLSLHLLGLNCTGCHQRESAGGPREEILAHFLGTADLGEQGRLPPTLTGAGAKLRTSAIERILDGQGRVRPYMLTRMPNFGASATQPLPKLFAQADGGADSEEVARVSDELANAGARLAGIDGFACISCHGISGYPSLGVPAIDLSYTYARLRHEWFDKYMRDPAAIYPGTRMPSFWQPGAKAHPELLAGDPGKQINALWSYLSLGSSMSLPKGMVAGGEFALMPTDRTIVLGTFMDGLSARCFAVGFPQQIHFVYDADHRRTAKAWRGKFMDAAGTWFGRAGLLCEPEGVDVIDFPAGDPIAILASAQGAWPSTAGRDAGWRYLGSDRDSHGTPTFRTAAGDLYIEERISPASAVGGAHLVREFVIRARKEIQGATVRAWTAPTIAAAPGGGFKAAGGPTIFVTGGVGFVRDSGAATAQHAELLVPVGFRTGSDPDYPFEARISLELAW